MAIRLRGYSSTLIINAIEKDLSNKEILISTKLWACRRGFTGTRVHVYGITQLNYRYHIPDFDYYKLHPINGRYSSWIDDKMTMKYIFSPFNEFMPNYYFKIKDEEIIRLMDCPNDIKANVEGIINILERNGSLSLKLSTGSLGEGFYRLDYKNENYYINTKKVNVKELEKMLDDLNGYLVTEYIIAHKEIKKIYDVTPNTLRVQVIKDKNKEPKIIGSFMRFGTKRSGVLEIADAGTIFTGVNIENRILFDAKRLIGNKLENLEVHPDTNENLEIELPHWDDIKDKIYKILSYVPELSYLGFDIIITDKGFKIIEINFLSALTFLPYYYPLFEEEYSREFFKRKFKEKPKQFKRVLEMLKEFDV